MVRVGRERCASAAYLPGSGPFVKWIALSVDGPAAGRSGTGRSTFDLASVYVPPWPSGAEGRSHADIRYDVLGAMDATPGQRATLMGDINCHLWDDSPGAQSAQSWAQALNGTGYVAIGRMDGWGHNPTRVPRGAQSGHARHIDAVVVSGPGMVRYGPTVVATGSDTEVDTPGYGSCPTVPGVPRSMPVPPAPAL